MKNESEMTFLEHLLEMRSRLLIIFLSLIFFSIIGYIYSNSIISFLLKSSNNSIVSFQVLKVTSIFMTKIIIY